MTYITHHAYYGSPLGAGKTQPLPNRVLLVPKHSRHGPVDDHDEWVVLIVGGTEAASALDGNANGFEITRTYRAVVRDVVYTGRFFGTAFDIKSPGIGGDRGGGRWGGRRRVRVG